MRKANQLCYRAWRPNKGGGGGGGGGTVTSIEGIDSVQTNPNTITGAGTVQLVGDEPSPPALNYYGTDGAGNLGYQPLSLNDVLIGNTIVVSKLGNNATGARNDWNKHFLTIAAAEAVYQAGDVIVIAAGSYTVGGSIVNKSVITLGQVTITNSGGVGTFTLFTFNSAMTVPCIVDGDFILNPISTFGGVLFNAPAFPVQFKFKEMNIINATGVEFTNTAKLAKASGNINVSGSGSGIGVKVNATSEADFHGDINIASSAAAIETASPTASGDFYGRFVADGASATSVAIEDANEVNVFGSIIKAAGGGGASALNVFSANAIISIHGYIEGDVTVESDE